MNRASRFLASTFIALFAVSSSLPVAVQGLASRSKPPVDGISAEDLKAQESELRPLIERYVVDRGSLTRSYPVLMSSARRARFQEFYSGWLATLQKLDFDSMSQAGKVDYVLFKNHRDYETRQLDIQAKQLADIQPLLPFANTITDLEETRRRMEPINSAKTAALLTDVKKQVDERRRLVELGVRPEGRGAPASDNPADAIRVKRTVANRAVIGVGRSQGLT